MRLSSTNLRVVGVRMSESIGFLPLDMDVSKADQWMLSPVHFAVNNFLVHPLLWDHDHQEIVHRPEMRFCDSHL